MRKRDRRPAATGVVVHSRSLCHDIELPCFGGLRVPPQGPRGEQFTPTATDRDRAREWRLVLNGYLSIGIEDRDRKPGTERCVA